MFLSVSSKMRADIDRQKFDKARAFAKQAKEIRRLYIIDLASESVVKRQLATVIWMIDVLTLRTGYFFFLLLLLQKSKFFLKSGANDKELETFGACSLLID